MKKFVNISLAVLMALNIVLGYTGITVFRMICNSEKGKVFTSLVDVRNECRHMKPEQVDCCKPSSRAAEISASCCDYSHSHIRMDDETRVQQEQNSTNHALLSIILRYPALRITAQLQQVTGEETAIHSPPPLLCLRKQPFQAFVQTYLI